MYKIPRTLLERPRRWQVPVNQVCRGMILSRPHQRGDTWGRCLWLLALGPWLAVGGAGHWTTFTPFTSDHLPRPGATDQLKYQTAGLTGRCPCHRWYNKSNIPTTMLGLEVGCQVNLHLKILQTIPQDDCGVIFFRKNMGVECQVNSYLQALLP